MPIPGFLPVIVAVIERQFGLSSTQSGLIFIMEDVAFIICAIPVVQLTTKIAMPVKIGTGMILLGSACFFMLGNRVRRSYLLAMNYFRI